MSKNPFTFRNGHVAHTYSEFIELCRQFPEDACYHLFERHFESWFRYRNDAEAACFLEACTVMHRQQYDKAQKSAQAKIDVFFQVYNRHHKELFVFRNGQMAHTYEELLDLCRQYPEDGLYHLREGHFEPWFRYIGRSDRDYYINACSAIRNDKTQKTAPEQIEDFISRCQLPRDLDTGDGQHWVAGWD